MLSLTHTYHREYRATKVCTTVTWTLSLAHFKYVTQLNHYNHWFILITASPRPNSLCLSCTTLTHRHTHIYTNTILSTHWELPFCRRHIFYRLNILLRATLVKVLQRVSLVPSVCLSHLATKVAHCNIVGTVFTWKWIAITKRQQARVKENEIERHRTRDIRQFLVLYCVPFLKVSHSFSLSSLPQPVPTILFVRLFSPLSTCGIINV